MTVGNIHTRVNYFVALFLIISFFACISSIVNRSVFIKFVQPGEHAGGEEDTNDLQQGQAQADRSNQEQVQGQLSGEPRNSDGKGKTLFFNNLAGMV